MLPAPQQTPPIVQNWLSRHRHPVSFALHMIGIPATIVGVLLTPFYLAAASGPIFGLAVGLFVGGYALQFLGHGIEGSEIGELMVARRLWRRAANRRAIASSAAPAPQAVA